MQLTRISINTLLIIITKLKFVHNSYIKIYFQSIKIVYYHDAHNTQYKHCMILIIPEFGYKILKSIGWQTLQLGISLITQVYALIS